MPSLVNQLELDKCPHCNTEKPLMAQISGILDTDRHSGGNRRFWRTYKCSSCGGVVLASSQSNTGRIVEMYPSGSKVTYDFQYLPKEVAEDFREALACYSISSFNAFAAMCRRTVQSMSTDIGAKGKDRVLQQLKDMKEIAEIDDDTFEQLKQIVIAGHDGAHPHLPKLTAERGGILLELMKDILYQLYVRKEKIKEAIVLRNQSISQKNENS